VATHLSQQVCEEHGPFRPCPICGHEICLVCEDWHKFHTPWRRLAWDLWFHASRWVPVLRGKVTK
jgi:hypothetical protein